MNLIFCLMLALVPIALAAGWPKNMDDPCLHSPMTCKQPPLNYSNFKSVMIVVAHPDDESCGGGTIAKFAQMGLSIHFVWLTKGECGTANTSLTPVDVAYIRHQEAINAAKVFGSQVTWDFLWQNDGQLQNTLEIRGQLVFLYRKYQPDVVLTWNPNHYFNLYPLGTEHADHRTAGEIALDCAYPLARDFLYFPEQLEGNISTWKVKEVWLFSWRYDRTEPASNIYIDISNTIDAKIQSLLQHKSQIGDPSSTAAGVRAEGAKLGNVVGVTYAEWFTRIVEMS